MKLLGLDVGLKRIGVAVSDHHIITTFGVIENSDLNFIISEISRIVRQESIEKIIIGIPKNRDNLQADKIHKFALELTKNLNIDIDYIDETLTSKEAERVINNKKINPRSKKYKEEIDKISAKLILEQYLTENQKAENMPKGRN